MQASVARWPTLGSVLGCGGYGSGERERTRRVRRVRPLVGHAGRGRGERRLASSACAGGGGLTGQGGGALQRAGARDLALSRIVRVLVAEASGNG